MKDVWEKLFLSHGPYWIIAFIGVAINKLYSKESQTIKTVGRSILSSLAISFLMVEELGASTPQAKLFAYVFVASISSDVAVEVIMGLGQKVKEDPTILTRFWGKK